MIKSLSLSFFFIAITARFLIGSENKIVDEITFKQTLYTLEEGTSFKEITSCILVQDNLPELVKHSFIKQGRRFFVFSYPSDGLKVKSMISFTEGNKNQPLICILRGASRMEGLPAFLYPSKEIFVCMESDAIVIAACYRDGVSEGKDEYGGVDVNDVYNLTTYLPKMFDKLNIKINENKRYLIGLSRGGMQMFLALAKFPEIQSYFNKFVSFCGILNINLFASKNPDWCEKMERNFNYDGSQAWLDQRNPILAVPKISNKELPFLLIQGTADPKVSLNEGYSMLQVMRTYQFTNISYWEVEGGDHTLKNHPEYIKLILTWLMLDY